MKKKIAAIITNYRTNEKDLINDVAKDLMDRGYNLYSSHSRYYYDAKGNIATAYGDILETQSIDPDLAVVVFKEPKVGSPHLNRNINYCVENDIPVVFSSPPPSIITLSGSMKFARSIQDYASKLTDDGHIVLTPQHLEKHVLATQKDIEHEENLSEDEIENLHRIHNKKIDMSHTMIVVTENGYYGKDTEREINYAHNCSDCKIQYYDALHHTNIHRTPATMDRLYGMMPATLIEIRKTFVSGTGLPIFIETGSYGWTVNMGDCGSLYEDIDGTPEENLNRAINQMKHYFPKAHEVPVDYFAKSCDKGSIG